MNWTRVLAPAFVCTTPMLAAPAEAATVAEWRVAIDEIVRDIRATHPDPFVRTGELTFLRAVDDLKADLPSLTEEQRVVRAMQLIALLGDGHTYLEPTGDAFKLWYPFRLYQFTDGYFITSAHSSVADLAGAQVIEIAGRPVDQVVNAARALFGADNEFFAMERLYAVHNAALMRGLGFADADGALRVRLRLRNGRTVERTLTPRATDNPAYMDSDTIFEWVYRGEVYGMPFDTNADWIAAFGRTPTNELRTANTARPPFMTQRFGFLARALPERSGYYMQFNRTDSSDMIEFVRTSMAEIDRVRPRRLILDLRTNFGGDGSRVAEVAHEFIRRGLDRPWGDLYVITGRKTYSAALNLLGALNGNVNFTIVGEPTGAGLNSYGDPAARLYEDAELHLYVSTVGHFLGNARDRRPYFPVDVPAMMSFAEYIAGRDPAVDRILSDEDMRAIPEIVRTDGGAAARRVYQERARRYADLSWWGPPPEIDMRRACDSLVAAQRLPDALEACALTTEMHPFVWNSWYGLGLVQKEAGQTAAQASSFRCVLELDPTNFNGPELRETIAAAGGTVPLPAGCPTGQ